MLFIFLFVVFLSFYFWLFYKPGSTSNQNKQSVAAPTRATLDTQRDALKPDEDKPAVQIIDNRTSISEQPASTTATAPEVELAPPVEAPPEEIPATVEESESVNIGTAAEPETASVSEEEAADIEPVLTEEEAIALAVETTLAEDATTENSQPIHPHPPAPELVEVAIRDALEKSEDFSPPETADTDEAEPMRK